ncbi:MAG TPA: transposase [Chloroflexia bacterium]|jgi:hypothetical protein
MTRHNAPGSSHDIASAATVSTAATVSRQGGVAPRAGRRLTARHASSGGGRVDIKPGWYFCIFSPPLVTTADTTPYTVCVYVLERFDAENAHLIHATRCDTGEHETFSLFKLLLPPPGKPKTFSADAGTVGGVSSAGDSSRKPTPGSPAPLPLPPPLFAPTYQELLVQLEALHPGPAPSAEADISPPLLSKARYMLEVVNKVRRLMQVAEDRATKAGEKFNYTLSLKGIIAELQGQGDRISIATFYRYLDKQLRSGGSESRLAASLHRSTYKHHRLADAQLHMVDTAILRLGRLRKKEVYDSLRALHKRTGRRWIDLRKCGGAAREDLVEELCDTDVDMSDVLANPEKALLLIHVKLPSRAWFYAHFDWFTHQPDLGEEVITARYGHEAWEHNFLVFDSFVRLATLPLQYVFSDHTPIDVFTVDAKGSRKVTRLWLTVFLDAWSRSVLGFTLLAEHPCIESIQLALKHAIWPKDPRRELLHLYAKGVGIGEADDLGDLAHLRDLSTVQTSNSHGRRSSVAGHAGVSSAFDLTSLSDALWESHANGKHQSDGGTLGQSRTDVSGEKGRGGKGKGSKEALAKLISFGGSEGLAGLPLSGYGIPSQLFLDNAWAHHSHSLKQLAVDISDKGNYNNIELRWRPPYRARYGALIERFFGNLSGQIKTFLSHAGAIQSSHPRDVREAAEATCLLYEDIYIIIYLLILSYQHTPHVELNGMTPHEKWANGMLTTHPHVPPLTAETERLFWRLWPETRTVSREGVSLFNLHYGARPGDSNSMRLLRRDIGGKPVRYSIRYQPQDISQIALFKDGRWVGDLWAKRLVDPALGRRTMPKWKWEAAKRQAGSPRAALEVLGFVQAVEAVVEARQDEQREAKKSATPPSRGSKNKADRSSQVPNVQWVSASGGEEGADGESRAGSVPLPAVSPDETVQPTHQDLAPPAQEVEVEDAIDRAYTQLLSGFVTKRQA